MKKRHEMFNEIKPRCEHERTSLRRAEHYAELEDFSTALFILMTIPCLECAPIYKAAVERMKQ